MGDTSVKKKRIIAVCGIKNSGKTTLLVNLVRELTKRDFQVAVIKRDSHDFCCDIPGTDSYRMKEAGAYGTAVLSPSRVFIHRTGPHGDVKEIEDIFKDADIIFIEGFKHSEYPKIEVIRKAVSEYPVSNPKGRFLIVTDRKPDEFNEPTAQFENIEQIIDKILEQ